MADWKIIEGDCVEQMRAMPEASVPKCADCGRPFPDLPAACWERRILCHACATARTPDP